MAVSWIATERIGQLTGCTNPHWPLLVDAQGWPLLNDTGAWGALGVDEGANTEHSDGRLYFFFGDVVPEDNSGIKLNADLVAWTDDTKVLRHGGHLALGFTFVLPYAPTSVQGQDQWRFCGKCHGLFWNGDPNFKGLCPKDDGIHTAAGFNFVLPFNDTPVAGQRDWRFCGKCAGLFWSGDPNFSGSCPGGGGHTFYPTSFNFVLPFGETAVEGQGQWRFCGKCGGLFYNGYPQKGVCFGAPGGGFHVHAVVSDTGQFDPFAGDAPIGQTLTVETPNGAFSYGGRVYVFAGIAEQKWRFWAEPPRPGDPQAGCYLLSKARPDLPSNPAGPGSLFPPYPNAYRKEFLFSPRIGWCPRDQSRDRLESHDLLGFRFVLPHDVPETPTRQSNWRPCRKCGALFWDGDAHFKGRCPRGDEHVATGANYVLPHDVQADGRNQASWRFCGKCAQLFWNGDPNNQGLCAAGGEHQAAGLDFVLAHLSIAEDEAHQANWRFCGKCAGLFFSPKASQSGCPAGGAHSAIGWDFVLRHKASGEPGDPEDPQNQGNWRSCSKCRGLFWNGDSNFKGVCPRGGIHTAAADPEDGKSYLLRHDAPEDPEHQANWRFCAKCAGLFWAGDPNFQGACPATGIHIPAGWNFVLPHNAGEDAQNEGGWRFCTKCHGMVQSRQEDVFPWVAPVVIQNSDHPGLPFSPYRYGVVMFGFGFSGRPGIRLAWMPLPDITTSPEPRAEDIRYYTGNASEPWSSEAAAAAVLLPHANTYTHLSAAWLEEPQRWIVLYGTAYDAPTDAEGVDRLINFRRPAMARIGTTLWDWSDEIPVFDPGREQAYGKYMHWPGLDTINPDVPPTPFPAANPGSAYGVFILKRFTEWNAAGGELGIYYLLSTSAPYQVHVVHTRLRID